MNREKENEIGYGTQVNSGRLSAQGLTSGNAWNTAMNPAGIYSQASRTGGPPLKEAASKFSSWNINSKSSDAKPVLGGEVDEFLMFENDAKTPNHLKKELLSLSGSMDLDNNSYDEIEDEMVRGGLDRVKVSINGVT